MRPPNSTGLGQGLPIYSLAQEKALIALAGANNEASYGYELGYEFDGATNIQTRNLRYVLNKLLDLQLVDSFTIEHDQETLGPPRKYYQLSEAVVPQVLFYLDQKQQRMTHTLVHLDKLGANNGVKGKNQPFRAGSGIVPIRSLAEDEAIIALAGVYPKSMHQGELATFANVQPENMRFVLKKLSELMLVDHFNDNKKDEKKPTQGANSRSHSYYRLTRGALYPVYIYLDQRSTSMDQTLVKLEQGSDNQPVQNTNGAIVAGNGEILPDRLKRSKKETIAQTLAG